MNIKNSVLVFLFLLFNANLIASEYYQATTQLNIRSGPSKDFAIVGSLAKGDSVLIDSIVSGWGQVIVANQIKGYVFIKYLSKDFKPPVNSSSSDSSGASKKESSPWKSILTIIVLILIVYYQIFGKNKSSSSNGGSSRTSGASHSSERQNSQTPKKTIMEKTNYYCEYCGTKSSSISSLTSGFCYRHPSGANKGKHSPYQGSEKSQYTCKYCGTKSSSISSLTSGFCYRHPSGANKGKHSPTL